MAKLSDTLVFRRLDPVRELLPKGLRTPDAANSIVYVEYIASPTDGMFV